MTTPATPSARFDPASITRPEPVLLKYYLFVSLLTVFGFPFAFLPLYFKYRTLQYRFDDKGISMSWGILFKRETYLTYRRIQDIHVTRNLIHRWLGLAAVSVQTASGSSSAEMTIEGIGQPELLRDFLYQQMRGVHDDHAAAPAAGPTPPGRSAAASGGAPTDEALALLREIRDGLRAIRAAKRGGP